LANVHKDFHGALSYGLSFLQERFGPDGARAFLEGLASTVYRPLVEDLQARGLPALRDHWQRIFDLEGGDAEMQLTEDELVLRVHRCPAIAHMREHGYPVADNFCEHTRIVNDAICRAAGYEADLEYDQEAGRCVQRFRRAAK
jgi:hypothetical protein